jgi:hypothetical protein
MMSDVDALEILVFEHDELSFFVFVTLDHLVPRHLASVRLRDALVIHRARVARPQQPEPQLLPPCRRVQSHGNVDETKADRAFPKCAHERMDPCSDRKFNRPTQ